MFFLFSFVDMLAIEQEKTRQEQAKAEQERYKVALASIEGKAAAEGATRDSSAVHGAILNESSHYQPSLELVKYRIRIEDVSVGLKTKICKMMFGFRIVGEVKRLDKITEIIFCSSFDQVRKFREFTSSSVTGNLIAGEDPVISSSGMFCIILISYMSNFV